ncbi:MAG: pilus assembly protein PilZ [Deltaproteobacteria bacterium]|jgi:Tfp pilus assembly protein PilZ|nr:pilus assembly protein PilZ [Deltaproteobacteria bacterium]MCW8893272.1 pilus assembly protein PilZ [Deltaproteobacteria bacterium]MCW9050322.1 pilus assembly protein PilZ [Deltaproteobacteria bacterium]
MTVERNRVRKKKRLKVRFGVDYPKRIAFTGDASAVGLYIITGQPERPGSKLLIELSLPDEQQVIAFGRVRWAKKVPPNLIRVANKAGMGVQLTKFEAGEQIFKDYLATLRH